MTDKIIAPNFLFRFAIPCRQSQPLWTDKPLKLAETYQLQNLSELEGRPTFADVRFAWSEEGFAFTLDVRGKSQAPWCRDTKIQDSDGLQVWIDTRDTHNVHRAGRFCHRFAFLPAGAGPRLDQPLAALLAINRARESPREIPRGALQCRSSVRPDGYHMEGFIPAVALTGFDPSEHKAIGFTYCVADRELGVQTFTVGPEFPFDEDPSVWGTLDLVK